MAQAHYRAPQGLEADGRRLARAALTAKDGPLAFMPIDHFLLCTTATLPAIIVTQLPGGAISFIVVCQSFGFGLRARWLQVMDPASKRRWLRAEQLRSLVYTPHMRIPVARWLKWAASDDFAAPLETRLGALGIRPARAAALYQTARARSWRALACLDAATRMTGHRLHRAAPRLLVAAALLVLLWATLGATSGVAQAAGPEAPIPPAAKHLGAP